MQSTYKKTTVHVPVYTECSAEYTLPDYQGDIKRVLSSEARILPAGKFMNGDEVQLAGCVAYEILYADTEGKLTSAQFSSEYEICVPLGANSEDAMAQMSVSALSVRLSGPRRISVKGHVCAHVCSFGYEDVQTTGDALEESLAAQVLRQTLPVRYTVYAEDAERTYTDTVPVSECAEEHVQLLTQGGEVYVRDIAAEDGAVSFVAEACMYALVNTEAGRVRCLRRSVSVEERMEVEGMRSTMKPTVGVSSSSVHAVIETDADGAETVRLSTRVSYGVRADDNAQLAVITDGYLCREDTENEYAELPYEEHMETRTVVLGVDGETPLSECGCELMRELLYTAAAVKNLRVQVGEDGRLHTEGEMQVHAIGHGDDVQGDVGFCPIKASLPLAGIELSGAAYPADAVVEIGGVSVRADGVIDGDRILWHGECAVCVHVCGARSCRYLASMQRRGQSASRPDGSVVTVYYPSPTDTLWDIARAYHTTVDALAADNGLESVSCMTEASALPVRPLLIL